MKKKKSEICGGSELPRPLSVSKFPWLAIMMLCSHIIKPSPGPAGRLHTVCIWQVSKMETFKSQELIYFLSYYFLRGIESHYLPVPASGKIFNIHILFAPFSAVHFFFLKTKKLNSLFLFKGGMWTYFSATEVQLAYKCWHGTNKLLYAIFYYLMALFFKNFNVQNQSSFMFLHFS